MVRDGKFAEHEEVSDLPGQFQERESTLHIRSQPSWAST